MFGFISKVVSTGVKTVLTPVAVVRDIVEDEPFELTNELLESAGDDISDAFDDLLD